MDCLASVAGFSKYHFVREFKRVTSYTVVTYINLARIERSKELLAQGEMTVGEIAFACGYKNLSYFSFRTSLQFFKKRVYYFHIVIP